MQEINKFKDYELLDMASKEKLEKWGKYILVRPDPQICWSRKEQPMLWEKIHARYVRSSTGGGHWENVSNLPASWQVTYLSSVGDLIFNIKPMGFKHTGLFPEQASNWDYMIEKIVEAQKVNKEVKILNLFAYTGGATVACLKAGASVCHVDASKGMVEWAKENVKTSNLGQATVRYIVDDVIKFVKREIKRGNKYDGIVMDPPSYGRGSSNEIWNIEDNIEELLDLCTQMLTSSPLFILINTYTSGLAGSVICNTLDKALYKNRVELLSKGKITTREIGIMSRGNKYILPCGITTKWNSE